MKTTINSPSKLQAFDVEPVLRKVFIEAEEEHKELQKMFELMGWSHIPDALKVEIKEDVAAMVNELQGQYSSCDPYVERRRKSVTYWVSCYKDGICSLDTAVKALRIKKL